MRHIRPALDVIVRGGSPVTPWVYVLRGQLTGKPTAEFDRLVDRAANAIVMPAFGVGAAGRTSRPCATSDAAVLWVDLVLLARGQRDRRLGEWGVGEELQYRR